MTEPTLVQTLLLSHIGGTWRKAAMIIGSALTAHGAELTGFDDLALLGQLQALAASGRIEARGDRGQMHYLEVRLTGDLASRIRNSFPRVVAPLRISTSANDEGTSDHFAQTSWPDHDFAQLELRTFALRCFTPEATACFLPAFLLAAVEHPESGLADCVTDFLVPPDANPHRPSFWSWWSLLSPEQRSTVVEFLKRSRSAEQLTPAIQNLEA